MAYHFAIFYHRNCIRLDQRTNWPKKKNRIASFKIFHEKSEYILIEIE